MEGSSKPTGSDAAQSAVGMLRALFAMQIDLNDYVFSKIGSTGSDGRTLTISAISEAAMHGRLEVNDSPNQWLRRYAVAMQSELNELRSEWHWKWWSKDRIDLQNIRVELIDILHLPISAMISTGLTVERVFGIYQQKHAVDLNRRNSGYSQATKTEDDNRNVK